jgi:hypothetical protein
MIGIYYIKVLSLVYESLQQLLGLRSYSKSTWPSTNASSCLWSLLLFLLQTSVILSLIDMFQKFLNKTLFILKNKPLINCYIVVPIHLVWNDLFLKSIRSSQSLDISTKMSETMKLNNHIFKVLPFRNHNIARNVIQIVLRNARNSCLHHRVVDLHLCVGAMCLDTWTREQTVNFIAILIDLRTVATQIQVAIVHIHRLCNVNLFSMLHILINQRVNTCQFDSIIKHTKRPK